jgi:FAD/FMN-containing dehydrogenase
VDQLEKAQVNLEKATAIFNTTATYYNENSLEEVNWQESNWGANYRRLLDIKRAIDPNTVFSCRHCVGSEDGF